jgi:xylulokinase
MVAAGIYASVPEACEQICGVDKVQEPITENVPVYEKFFRLYDKVYPAVKEQMKELAEM